LDATRQYGRTVSEIRPDHVKRYELAARYASGRVLDAACGCGYGSSILRGAAREVLGLDIEPEAIEWAKRYYPGDYVLGKIEDEPWTGSFETVVSFETLEHLKDPRVALNAFRRACTGSLIASVPNELRFPFSAEKFAGDKYPHQRHYTPEQFEELLDSCGFAVMEYFCQKDKRGEIHGGVDGMFLVVICE
jgi:2-polyprenyl-3-methyl-5-hydroxy-6-metoxy-1,4-benzoquinol methylase